MTKSQPERVAKCMWLRHSSFQELHKSVKKFFDRERWRTLTSFSLVIVRHKQKSDALTTTEQGLTSDRGIERQVPGPHGSARTTRSERRARRSRPHRVNRSACGQAGYPPLGWDLHSDLPSAVDYQSRVRGDHYPTMVAIFWIARESRTDGRPSKGGITEQNCYKKEQFVVLLSRPNGGAETFPGGTFLPSCNVLMAPIADCPKPGITRQQFWFSYNILSYPRQHFRQSSFGTRGGQTACLQIDAALG